MAAVARSSAGRTSRIGTVLLAVVVMLRSAASTSSIAVGVASAFAPGDRQTVVVAPRGRRRHPPSRSSDPPRASWWPFWRGDDDGDDDSGDGDADADSDGGGRRRRGSATSTREAEAMRRTAKMMEEHRRSQEASERAAAIMDELSSALIVGRSAAGPGGGGGILGIGGGEGARRGGVRVTFNGLRRPVAVDVDPRFLFSSSSLPNVNGGGVDGGVISAEELNDAIADAMRDGYERSGRIMDDRLKGLYEQLGLSRDPAPLPSPAQDEKGK